MRNRIMGVMASLALEMQDIVRLAAFPARPGELIKGQINRSARVLRLTPRRAETFWYGRATHVAAEEADRLRAWKRGWAERRRVHLEAEMRALDQIEGQLMLDIITEEHRAGS